MGDPAPKLGSCILHLALWRNLSSSWLVTFISKRSQWELSYEYLFSLIQDVNLIGLRAVGKSSSCLEYIEFKCILELQH